MYPAISATNDPTAIAPPSHARRQLTCGLAFIAIVAIVPWFADGVPPGVYVGVCVTMRRVV